MSTLQNLIDEVENLKSIVMELKNKVNSDARLPRTTSSSFQLSRKVSDQWSIALGLGAKSSKLGFERARAAGNSGGMTQAQGQQFKKMELQVNSIQHRVRELEGKIAETQGDIEAERARISDLTYSHNNTGEELFQTITDISATISEKIALQRIELKKLANAEEELINYDPFNYEDAYSGNVIDFDARKRILEIKTLMAGVLQDLNKLKQQRERASEPINLGYQIVRMDQLLNATGFDNKIKSREASKDEVLVVEKSPSRTPGSNKYPPKEMFQSKEEDKKGAFQDTILQHMYRLQHELGQFQKLDYGTELKNIKNCLKDLQVDIQALNKRRLEDESELKKKTPRIKITNLNTDTRDNSFYSSRTSQANNESFVTKDVFSNVINNLNMSVDTLLKNFRRTEADRKPMTSAVTKFQGTRKDGECLTCDRPIDRTSKIDTVTPILPPFHSKDQSERLKYKYIFHKGFVVSAPKAPRGIDPKLAFDGKSMMTSPEQKIVINPPTFKDQIETRFVTGLDGKVYLSM